MNILSNNLQASLTDVSPVKARQRRSQKSLRRKKSRVWTIRRNIARMLRSRQLFPIVLGLFLLASFIHVSLMNDVLSLEDDASVILTENKVVTSAQALVVPHQPKESPAVLAGSASQDVKSETSLASEWAAVDLRSLTFLPIQANETTGELVKDTSADSLLPDASSSDRDVNSNGNSMTTHVVNEGGSLWRTGKRFIDDEVLLDKLIDNLAQSGMDVRSVRAGVAFIVNDLGSEGMLVMVEDDGATYETRIVGDRVTTSVLEEEARGA